MNCGALVLSFDIIAIRVVYRLVKVLISTPCSNVLDRSLKRRTIGETENRGFSYTCQVNVGKERYACPEPHVNTESYAHALALALTLVSESGPKMIGGALSEVQT